MPHRLLLTRNAQFCVLKDGVDPAEAIEALLNAATANMTPGGEFLINEFRLLREIPASNYFYRFSVCVFPTDRDVYFWGGEKIRDRIYAFALVFEVQEFVVLFKKSCANFSDIFEESLSLVDSKVLNSTFSDNSVDFQKISLRNMTVSERALRARSYEAADLKGLLSSHAAGRSIPYFLKIRDGDNIKSISANSARIVESSERTGIDEIALWVRQQIYLLQNPTPDKDFLESFAKQVALQEVLAETQPNAILIEGSTVYDRLHEKGLPLFFKTRAGELAALPARIQKRLFRALEVVYEVNGELKIIGLEETSRIRVNSKSITFSSTPLQRIRVCDAGKDISLQKYILKHGLYSVCFANPKFMYFMGRCFEDAAGVAEIESILELLKPIDVITGVQSEKGCVSATLENFDDDCMFGVVETLHANDDFVFCDDLGNEWADHITLNRGDPCISFVHSKHGSPSTSASNLHDLVGQGIKNLGNMYFTREGFLKKHQEKFSEYYSRDGIQTKIARTRKAINEPIEAYIQSLLSDYRILRKCVLSCSFLSKDQVTEAFNAMKTGQVVRGNVIQLFWILSSFAHAAKEYNVVPIIYCQK
ncbi:hypothetical protein [Zoogloea sp.]|uniref:hypothetical protein n=1 Tax=Zoogloea sp. TaxID=49181 RepID=UPI0025EF81DB|nr:hypothetical protein [Zoogloea sp.]MCK6393312.1 hypothetical protein [Zoogloea sp.]